MPIWESRESLFSMMNHLTGKAKPAPKEVDSYEKPVPVPSPDNDDTAHNPSGFKG